MKKFIERNKYIILIVFILLVLIIIVDSLFGKSLLNSSIYNSYELQAKAWLSGHTYLDKDYPYLELAIYGGNYFVSFPPLPSVILLPFVIIFGNNIPTNLIMFIVFIIEVVVIYKIVKRYNSKEYVAILLSLGFTIGTNLMSLLIDSGVWFIAQIFNNCLCILAIDAFLKDKKSMAYFYLALAVGCRPFTAIYMIMIFIYYLVKEKDKSFIKKLWNNIKPVYPAIIIAIIYMIYNYIRFDNPIEFGHNYLPEFVREENGQFSIHYLLPNLKSLFFNKIYLKDGNIAYDMPFCFLIANPIFIMYIYRSIKSIIVTKKIDILRLMIFIATIINILFICLHRTLGGWQFGARYTCDLLPFIFLAIITYKGKKNKDIKLDFFEICCIIFGIILNIYGAISLYSSL